MLLSCLLYLFLPVLGDTSLLKPGLDPLRQAHRATPNISFENQFNLLKMAEGALHLSFNSAGTRI